MGRKQKFTDAQLRASLKQCNHQPLAVAALLDCSMSTVYKRMAAIGLQPITGRSKTHDTDFQGVLLRDYKGTVTGNDLALKHEVSVATVRHTLLQGIERTFPREKAPFPNNLPEYKIAIALIGDPHLVQRPNELAELTGTHRNRVRIYLHRYTLGTKKRRKKRKG